MTEPYDPLPDLIDRGEDDEATGRLLVAAALHEAATHGEELGNQELVDAARRELRRWEEDGKLEGAMFGVVMGYALNHASPDDQEALRRWFKAVTAQ